MFGNVEMAKKWKEETNCSYPIVSDEKRILYRHFHFPSSVKHTWDTRSQTWYAEQLRQGRVLHPMKDGDDPHQLAGDVIVNADKKLSLIYRSKSPIDRPSIRDIISHCKSNI